MFCRNVKAFFFYIYHCFLSGYKNIDFFYSFYKLILLDYICEKNSLPLFFERIQDKFSRTCGVSSGFLRQGRSFNVEFVKIIRDKFTDLNLKWVIFDEGEMLLSSENIAKRTSEVYGLNYKDKYIDVLEENRKLNKKKQKIKQKK